MSWVDPFAQTSQGKRWLLSDKSLQHSYQKSLDASLQNSPSSDVAPVSVQEQKLLVTYYSTAVDKVCEKLGLSEDVIATAKSYLKRFYVNNSVLDYHPKDVFLTCILLASKVEGFYLSVTAFSAVPGASPKGIADFEFTLSQAVQFDYKVHHAHVALRGILLDVQSVQELSKQDIHNLFEKAHFYVAQSRNSDLELRYPPSLIAAAAFSLASPDLFSKWADQKSEGFPVPVNIFPQVDLIKSELEKPLNLDPAILKEADRKVKLLTKAK